MTAYIDDSAFVGEFAAFALLAAPAAAYVFR
jgi:hypothetical protein